MCVCVLPVACVPMCGGCVLISVVYVHICGVHVVCVYMCLVCVCMYDVCSIYVYV